MHATSALCHEGVDEVRLVVVTGLARVCHDVIGYMERPHDTEVTHQRDT